MSSTDLRRNARDGDHDPDELDRQVRANDAYRGALLQFETSGRFGSELVSFLPRPELSADQVILPPGLLETIERQVVRSAQHNAQLVALGQHLKRGLLLHGAPGTGKTHTVRYLLSRLEGVTAAVLSGNALTTLLPAATALVRRLEPAVLIIEDVDLIAQDREASHGAVPLLFELLNRVDGIDTDADVTFIMTTNRCRTWSVRWPSGPGGSIWRSRFRDRMRTRANAYSGCTRRTSSSTCRIEQLDPVPHRLISTMARDARGGTARLLERRHHSRGRRFVLPPQRIEFRRSARNVDEFEDMTAMFDAISPDVPVPKTGWRWVEAAQYRLLRGGTHRAISTVGLLVCATAAHAGLVVLRDDLHFATAASHLTDVRQRRIRDVPVVP